MKVVTYQEAVAKLELIDHYDGTVSLQLRDGSQVKKLATITHDGYDVSASNPLLLTVTETAAKLVKFRVVQEVAVKPETVDTL